MRKNRMFVMLFCVLGLLCHPMVFAVAQDTVFTDVPASHWAKNAIQSFAQQGMIAGNGDGTFSPNSGVTREQFSKMLLLTFQAPTASGFSDGGNERH